jgi:mevalonate kinase
MPFTLTNAAAVGASGPVGTTGGSSAAVAKTYRLDAAESMISPHVGHKVEITGTVEDQAGSTASASATAAGASASSTVNAPKLKAESVKMVAATCE